MRGHQAIDISGQRFGYLTVIDRAESVGSDRGLRWNCQCDCGKQVIVPSARLRQGKTKSCGCMQKQIIAEKMTKHGMRDTRLYRIWCGMKARCTNPHVKDFRNYGGRGVSVCSEWLEQFDQFADWALEHGYDDSLTIDRIDVNGNYEPANCRWVTKAEQNRNKRAPNGKKAVAE